MIVPNHRERQLMQYLRGGGWVKASTLPPGPRLIEGLLLKGWIEHCRSAAKKHQHKDSSPNGDRCYLHQV